MQPSYHNPEYFKKYSDLIKLGFIAAAGGLAIMFMMLYYVYGSEYVAETSALIVFPGAIGVSLLLLVYRLHMQHLNEQIKKNYTEFGTVPSKVRDPETCIMTYAVKAILIASFAPVIFCSYVLFFTFAFSGGTLSWAFVEVIDQVMSFFKSYMFVCLSVSSIAATVHLIEYSRHNSFKYRREG